MILNVSPIELNTETRFVTCKMERRRLSRQQLIILTAFMRTPRALVPSSALIAALYLQQSPPPAALDFVFCRLGSLRKALAAIGAAGMIRNVRKQGWVFGMPDTPHSGLHAYALNDAEVEVIEAMRAAEADLADQPWTIHADRFQFTPIAPALMGAA